MVQQGLVEYIQRLLQQGYSASTIRTTLLNAGYSNFDVEESMRVAGAAPKQFLSTMILLFIFLSLLVLSGFVLFLLRVTQEPPAVLSFSVSLFSREVSPGGEVIVSADISNPGGTRTSGLLDYEVRGPEGGVLARTESFTVDEQVSVPAALSLPPTVSPGRYVLAVTLSYGKKSSVQSEEFEVVAEKPAPVEAVQPKGEVKELELACPGGCDDLNFCTSDSCVSGACVHSILTPCCGNRVCEQGESESSCPLDCAAQVETLDQVRERARNRAASDVSGALAVCDSLGQQAYIDHCYADVAEAGKQKSPCESIAADDVRDSCYLPFAYQNDFSVCEKIVSPLLKNSCLSLQQVQQYQGQAQQG